MSVEEFLNSIGMKQAEEKKEPDKWSAVVPKPTSKAAPCLLITGDVGTGKSGLAYWLLEHFSQEYGLLPVVVGFPRNRRELLPPNFVIASIQEVKDISDAVIFIDEADLQLPFTDSKVVPEVINFLNLPRHRQQILILAFHYPRLIRGTYLPSFSGFLLKRPPYLLQFAGKKDSRELTAMMERAEERFSELPEDDVVSYTYVVAPRLRWQGILKNSLCSFWNEDLSRAWGGVDGKGTGQLGLGCAIMKENMTKIHISQAELQAVIKEMVSKGEDVTELEQLLAKSGREKLFEHERGKTTVAEFWESYHSDDKPTLSPEAEDIKLQLTSTLYPLKEGINLDKFVATMAAVGCPWERGKGCPCNSPNLGKCPVFST